MIYRVGVELAMHWGALRSLQDNVAYVDSHKADPLRLHQTLPDELDGERHTLP